MPQQGNHYWTGVKTEGQLILPGTSSYELKINRTFDKHSNKISKITCNRYYFVVGVLGKQKEQTYMQLTANTLMILLLK